MAYELEINIARGGTVINGKDGMNGADGKSAYQAAVEGGYQGTEQEFNVLLANAGLFKRRETATVELGENTYIVSSEGAYGLRMCSWGNELPVGTEIASIKLYTDEYGWFDLRNAIASDPNHATYYLNIYKTFVTSDEDVLCFGCLGSIAGCLVADLAMSQVITNARITYYTDSVVSENE